MSKWLSMAKIACTRSSDGMPMSLSRASGLNRARSTPVSLATMRRISSSLGSDIPGACSCASLPEMGSLPDPAPGRAEVCVKAASPSGVPSAPLPLGEGRSAIPVAGRRSETKHVARIPYHRREGLRSLDADAPFRDEPCRLVPHPGHTGFGSPPGVGERAGIVPARAGTGRTKGGAPSCAAPSGRAAVQVRDVFVVVPVVRAGPSPVVLGMPLDPPAPVALVPMLAMPPAV